MKYAIVSVAAVAALAASASATIRITEWMYSGSEFVELTNVGPLPVDLTGWSYDDDSRTPGVIDLSGLGILAPGQSGILAELTEPEFRSLWNLPASVPIVGGNTANLGRSDEINIFDAANVLVDRLTYGDNTVGGPRTQNVSANPNSPADLGTNNVLNWSLSFVGDSFGSVTVVDANLQELTANPGRYPIPEPAALAAILAAGLVGLKRRAR